MFFFVFFFFCLVFSSFVCFCLFVVFVLFCFFGEGIFCIFFSSKVSFPLTKMGKVLVVLSDLHLFVRPQVVVRVQVLVVRATSLTSAVSHASLLGRGADRPPALAQRGRSGWVGGLTSSC